MVVIYHDFNIVIGNDYFTGKFQIKEKKQKNAVRNAYPRIFYLLLKGKN